MQNNILVWVIGVLIVLAGIVGFIMATSSQEEEGIEESPAMTESESMESDSMMGEDGMADDGTMEDDAMMEGEQGMMEGEESVMMSGGTYEAYDASKLAMADTGDVVLFFHASWCPTCRALDSDIMENSENIPAELTILKVDYDERGDLKKQYGVTTQHTMVQVDAQGNEITKWVGSNTLAELTSQVQ